MIRRLDFAKLGTSLDMTRYNDVLPLPDEVVTHPLQFLARDQFTSAPIHCNTSGRSTGLTFCLFTRRAAMVDQLVFGIELVVLLCRSERRRTTCGD